MHNKCAQRVFKIIERWVKMDTWLFEYEMALCCCENGHISYAMAMSLNCLEVQMETTWWWSAFSTVLSFLTSLHGCYEIKWPVLILLCCVNQSSGRGMMTKVGFHPWFSPRIQVVSQVLDPELLRIPRNKMQDWIRNTRREQNDEFPHGVLSRCCTILRTCCN